LRIHIEVTGMRGKSGLVTFLNNILHDRDIKTLAKATGYKPYYIYNNKRYDIIRRFKNYFIEEENRQILNLNEYDVAIFENPGITRYTMAAFSKLFRPDIMVIPNIRYEHLAGLGDTKKQIIEAFAMHLKYCKTAIVNEDIPYKDIFDTYAKRYNINLLYVDCSGKDIVDEIVNTYINIANVVLETLGYEKLKQSDVNNLRREVTANFTFRKSDKYEIEYFDASKINDVESMLKAFNYLSKQTTKKFAIISYFRRDRLDRTFTFQALLTKWALHPQVHSIYLAGHYYQPILRQLQSIDKYRFSRINKHNIEFVLNTIHKMNLALLLTVNSISKFMDRIREMLGG